MNFYEQLKTATIVLTQEEKTEQTLYGLEVLKKTYVYLRSGVYTDIRHKDLILKSLDHPIKEVAAHYGVSEQALSKAKYRIFKDLEEQLTPHFLKYVTARDWRQAEELLFLAQHLNLSDNYVVSAFTREVERRANQAGNPPVQDSALPLCTRELQILRAFSFSKMHEQLATLDFNGLNRLVYLLLLLDGKMGTPAERHKLFRFLRDGSMRQK